MGVEATFDFVAAPNDSRYALVSKEAAKIQQNLKGWTIAGCSSAW
jgi:hypothetical protein